MNDACDFKVTLLGTGTPIPSIDRFGPSTLIEAGDQKLLIDAGRGATIRLHQLNIPIGRLDALLLTHFHSDHISGVPDVWLTGWLESYFGSRQTPFRVIGPRGTKRLIAKLEEAYADDIRIRVADEKLPPDGIATVVEEYERDGMGRVAVISGDTRYNQNVVKYAMGADLLVHEVAIARPELLSEAHIGRIMAHHTTAREAGMVFEQTKPKLAAYTHLVFLASPRVPRASVAELVAETRQTYRGPLEVGEDLMSFEIGDTITVRRYGLAS